MKTKVHALAAALAFLTILAFWTSTVLSELFASPETIATVKAMILAGLWILIPAIAITGITGFLLGRQRKDQKTAAKKKRMPFIAVNGILVLVPAAIFLNSRASVGSFDVAFYGVQVIELIAGAINLYLLGLNFRDGLTITGRIRRHRRSS